MTIQPADSKIFRARILSWGRKPSLWSAELLNSIGAVLSQARKYNRKSSAWTAKSGILVCLASFTWWLYRNATHWQSDWFFLFCARSRISGEVISSVSILSCQSGSLVSIHSGRSFFFFEFLIWLFNQIHHRVPRLRPPLVPISLWIFENLGFHPTLKTAENDPACVPHETLEPFNV